MKISVTIILLFAVFNVFGQSKKILAPTPPMGWNSWNWFGKNEINEQNMRECIDAVVQEGLLDVGYQYFVIDGGWRDTKLGPNGELLAHPQKFPHGMKAIADYAHSKGLKFGLHTVPGTHDCGGDPVGGFGNEEIQIKQFVEWGLDFIKLDKCKYTDGWNEDQLKQTYTKWRGLLDNCGKDIILSISAYIWRDWYPEVGQMARTTDDIKARVSKGAVFDDDKLSVLGISDENNNCAKFAGSGYWNDPDMIATGNQGLTIEEQKSHFALWCIMSSPLFLGNDPRIMSKEEKKIIKNKMAISINQDPTEQGKKVKVDSGFEIWKKKLKNGEEAFLILNRTNPEKQKITLNLADYGLKANKKLQNVYTGDLISSQKSQINLELEPHSCLFFVTGN